MDTQSLKRTALILVAIFAVAAVLTEGTILRPRNLVNLIYQNSILLIVAFAQMLIIFTGGIDLSVGAILASTSVCVIYFLDYGMAVSVLIALALACFWGLMNGALVSFVKIPPFIATLATQLMITSLTQTLTNGATIRSSPGGVAVPKAATDFYLSRFADAIPWPVIILLALIILLSLFMRTKQGFLLRVVGGNETAAQFCGVSSRRVKISAYVGGALLSGLAGVLFLLRVGSGNPTAGASYPMDSIAAVTVGGISQAGGAGCLGGAIIGVVLIGLISNIMNLLDFSAALQSTVKGVIILVAIFLNSERTAYR